MIKVCNRVIEYSFYGLFLLIPWTFWKETSELFELNKMWLTWALTIVIVTAWIVKMVLQRRILFQKTPLDIPIGLFLLSQIISTIFSQDVHVSLWGYYSRFNGGLLSIISYIFLYYAFLSNFSVISSRFSVFGSKSIGSSVYQSDKLKTGKQDSDNRQLKTDNIDAIKIVKRLLSLGLISGLVVALWGLPSHFGYDPTCFLFRGTFDVSCWTDQFQPKVRIFSTLGQPDWLAAYLAILIPIAIAKAIQAIRDKGQEARKNLLLVTCYLLLVTLFYLDLLYTRARSGVLGIWLSLILFALSYIFIEIRNKQQKIRKSLLLIPCLLLLITFVIGTPINQIRMLTLEGIGSYFQKTATTASNAADAETQRLHESGGTESADIRLNVWTGAINAWKANSIIGSGVETFAFAYYKHKPASQNLTSEWDYLYNKAHNEYLNYLATTGIVGLGTYLLMIGYFLFRSFSFVMLNSFQHLNQTGSRNKFGMTEDKTLILALLAGYVSILVTNFFGFSVVITNIYLFMIPASVFALAKSDLVLAREAESRTTQSNKPAKINNDVAIWQWSFIIFIILASLFMILTLFRFWRADIAYALGYNLDRAGEYQQAYPALHKAVMLRGDELVFKDELSINDAYIAAALLIQEPPEDQKEQTISVATSLIQEAINTSNEIISKSPNNAVFWKTRTRLFHTLSQIDSRYLPRAVDSIEKASILAPADANIWYNLGVLYGQNNDIKKGIEALEKTVKLKPNYRNARYALGLYYHTASLDEKAIAQMQYILDHLNPQDSGALESIKNWGQ